MKRLALLCCASLSLSLLAADPAKSTSVSTTLESGRVHEECMRVEKGGKRSYHWKADGPVDFNIHRHEGSDVVYPVKRTAMRGDGGTFTADVAADYCWMWTARAKRVKLDGGIK
jgi:hypothetical protein